LWKYCFQIQEVSWTREHMNNTQIGAAEPIKLNSVKVRRLFESGAYSSSGAYSIIYSNKRSEVKFNWE